MLLPFQTTPFEPGGSSPPFFGFFIFVDPSRYHDACFLNVSLFLAFYEVTPTPFLLSDDVRSPPFLVKSFPPL